MAFAVMKSHKCQLYFDTKIFYTEFVIAEKKSVHVGHVILKRGGEAKDGNKDVICCYSSEVVIT